MSCVNVHVIESTSNPSTAPTDVGQHWINTATGNMWQSNGTASVANWVKVDADTDVKVKVSSADTTAGYLNDELTVSNGTNSTSPLQKSITSPGADEKLNIQFDQTKLALTSSQITDFTEATQDVIGSTIIAGSGISVSYNDAGNTFTVTNTAANAGINIFRYSGHFLNELNHQVIDGSGAGTIWPVTATPGYVSNEQTYQGIAALQFDDTTQEGAGWHHRIPSGVTTLTLEIIAKARTLPVGSRAVVPKLYSKLWGNNLTPSAFTNYTFSAQTVATTLNMQYYTLSVSLATAGLTAGMFYSMEFTRDAANASDTLIGDWSVVEIALLYT